MSTSTLTLTLAATEELTRTCVLELEPPRIGAEALTTRIVDVTSSSRPGVAYFHPSDPSWGPAGPSSWPGVPQHLTSRVLGLVCPLPRVTEEHVLRCQQQHPLHVSCTRTRLVLPRTAFQTSNVSSLASTLHFSVCCCCDVCVSLFAVVRALLPLWPSTRFSW